MPDRAPDHAKSRRLTYTSRARFLLVIAPVWIPAALAADALYALISGARRFGESFGWAVRSTGRFWYRDVYRVARYGSVLDDVDENGRPKAWQ